MVHPLKDRAICLSRGCLVRLTCFRSKAKTDRSNCSLAHSMTCDQPTNFYGAPRRNRDGALLKYKPSTACCGRRARETFFIPLPPSQKTRKAGSGCLPRAGFLFNCDISNALLEFKCDRPISCAKGFPLGFQGLSNLIPKRSSQCPAPSGPGSHKSEGRFLQ